MLRDEPDRDRRACSRKLKVSLLQTSFQEIQRLQSRNDFSISPARSRSSFAAHLEDHAARKARQGARQQRSPRLGLCCIFRHQRTVPIDRRDSKIAVSSATFLLSIGTVLRSFCRRACYDHSEHESVKHSGHYR